MSRRPCPAHPNRAALRNVAFAVLVVALLVAVVPIGGTGHAGGVPPVPRGAPLSAPAVGRSGSNAALGDRFPAPLGGPDPTLSAAATPAVQRLLQHRTEVASLVAHRGIGYAYATGVAWLAYAPWDHAFYVAAPPSSVDEILAGSTTVTAVIAVGAAPFGVAVDDATDQVWVTNTGSNNVTVINGTTQSVVANIPVPSEPLGIAVNPAQDRVFVSDFGSNEVTVLNGFTGQGLGNVSVGLKPIGLAVDNATDTVYVANQGSQNVSVITAGSATVNATVPIPTEGYDPSLQGVAYDSAHHLIWVTAGFTAAVINTSEVRAVDEIVYDPAGIAYDPANGDVCLTNSANVTFGCFTFGSGLQVDANVTFSETGLPPGTPWNVTLSPGPLTFGLGSSIRQTITGASLVIGVDVSFHAPGYNYSFTIEPAAGEVPNPLRGYVWSIGASPSFVNVSFGTGSAYRVQFNESGLTSTALAQSWAVTLGGFRTTSTGSSLAFWETNGTYSYSDSVQLVNWTSSPSAGNITVAGRSVNVTLNWTSTSVGSGGVYTITFQESGLTNGTRWVVNLQNSTAGTSGSPSAPYGWSAQVSAGTYEYTTSAPVGWITTNGSGGVVVTNASVTVDVDWLWVGYYPVTFTESGLPNGTMWGVFMGPSFNWSDTPSLVLDESNGTYRFSVAFVSGYSLSTANRTVVVQGSAVGVAVLWTVTVTYALTFQESGLPNGTQWSVELDAPDGASVLGTTAASISSSEPNGTYPFQVSPVASYGRSEYVAFPSNGTVSLGGAPETVDVRFSLAGGFFNVTFRAIGLPLGTPWSVGVGGAGVLSQGPTIVSAELNGTYAFTVGGAFGYDASPGGGTVTVRGAPVVLDVNFRLAPGFYPLRFLETGLGTGTPWSVSVGSTLTSTAPSIVFAEPNGSFPYAIAPVEGYRLALASGGVSVNGAAPPVVNVSFVSTDLYSITFEETGLPNGTGWAVSIGNQLDSSLGPTVTLFAANGSVGYLVLPVAGFTTTDSGFVLLAGANRTVPVHFVPQTYPVVVVEFGLPNGTLWSVQATNASTGFNATFSTTGNALVIDLPNGTYALSVRASGYGANLSTPTFTIAGKLLGSSPTVRFSAAGGPGGGAVTAEFSAEIVVAAVGAAVLGGVALGVFGAAWRRRSVRREGSAWLGELTDPGSDLEPIHRP